jgi:hypothetical protein
VGWVCSYARFRNGPRAPRPSPRCAPSGPANGSVRRSPGRCTTSWPTGCLC